MANQTLKKLQYDGKEVQVESAIRDGSGNTITSTYAKKNAANTFTQSQTIQGTTTSTKLLTTGKSTSSGATGGLYGKLGSDEYLLIGYGSSNLWIGANETAGTHHSGSTYISTGQNSRLKVSALIDGTRTNKDVAYLSDLDNAAYTDIPNTFTQNQTINGELYIGGKTAIYTSNEGGNFRTVAPDYDTTSGELDFESNVLRLYALYGTAQTGLQEEQYTEIRLNANQITANKTLSVTGAVNASSYIATPIWYNANATAGASWEIDASAHTLNVGARVKAPAFKQSDSTKEYVDLITGKGVNFGVSGVGGSVYYLQLFATLDQVYPVGSIYFSTNSSASPASLFGGTWEKLSTYGIYLWKTNQAPVKTDKRHDGYAIPLNFDFINGSTTTQCNQTSNQNALTSDGVSLTISQLNGASWGSNWGGYGTIVPNNLWVKANSSSTTVNVTAWKRIS